MEILDQKLLDKIARSVRFWDKWRWIMIPISFALIASVLAFAAFSIEFVNAIDLQDIEIKMNTSHILIAFTLGLIFGMHLTEFMRWFANALLGGYKTERLLLKYAANKQSDPNA